MVAQLLCRIRYPCAQKVRGSLYDQQWSNEVLEGLLRSETDVKRQKMTAL